MGFALTLPLHVIYHASTDVLALGLTVTPLLGVFCSSAVQDHLYSSYMLPILCIPG